MLSFFLLLFSFFLRVPARRPFGGAVVHRSAAARFSGWARLPDLGLSQHPRDHRDPNATVPQLPPAPGPNGTPAHAKLDLPPGPKPKPTPKSSGTSGTSGTSGSGTAGAAAAADASAAATAAATAPPLATSASAEAPAAVAAPTTGAYEAAMATRPWAPPQRAIHAPADLRAWQASGAHAELLRFVQALGGASRGVPCRGAGGESSAAVRGLAALLAALEAMIAEAPPVQQPMR
jgi:hypothetical protein